MIGDTLIDDSGAFPDHRQRGRIERGIPLSRLARDVGVVERILQVLPELASKAVRVVRAFVHAELDMRRTRRRAGDETTAARPTLYQALPGEVGQHPVSGLVAHVVLLGDFPSGRETIARPMQAVR